MVPLGAVAIGRLVADAALAKGPRCESGAMFAGIALTVIGETSSAGARIVARSFADSQIRLDPLAPFLRSSFRQDDSISAGD